MEASVRLGRIRGIELGIHYSWFIVFAIFTAILATQQFPDMYSDWSDAQYWSIAVAAVVLLFGSVIVHEFAHATVAQRKHIPVESIVLFIFGGVATISREPAKPGDEFKIAIAGPIASVLLSILFAGLWAAFGSTSEQLAALLGYLAFINLALAVFNLIPGFPLDGGRVLRALIWKATGNMRRATGVVSAIGVGIGTLFFVFGIIAILNGALGNGLWSIALGWFLQNAASQGYASVVQRELTSGVVVRDLMDRHPVTVEPGVTIADLIDNYILKQNVRGVPVVADGWVLGLVSLTDVKDVPAEQRSNRVVREVMTPRDKLQVFRPTTTLEDALDTIGRRGLNQVPVLDGDTLVGIVTRGDIMRYLQAREVLGLRTVEVAPSTERSQVM
ncbi:MAG: peptidase [Chloroflexi bacterium]|nr:MAG: peptidase [Chloroflexota bacterium]